MAMHYWELAAMSGHVQARHNIGNLEGRAGNEQRAFKHLMIAARSGARESLEEIKIGFMRGMVTKEEYENTLRLHHERQKEMKSEDRRYPLNFY